MNFENPSMTSTQLPDPLVVKFEGLNKRYRVSVILSIALMGLIFIALLSVTRFQTFVAVPNLVFTLYGEILAAVCLLTLLICSYQFIAIPYKQYCLREHDLHYSSGLLFRKTISQPIIRIQHIELKTGPIERIFSLATLQVYSAGGATFTFEIPGLSQATANRIKHFVLTHKDTMLDG
jgi:hypothetical protein